VCDNMEPTKPRGSSTGNDVFPFDFFAALNLGDDDTAMARMRAEAIPDGVPSPQAEALIKKGEWDTPQRLSLVFVDVNACCGRIGSDSYRFCGKPMNYCHVAAHTKVTVGKIKRGWYIASLGKTQGIFTSPFLPHMDDGGPIRPVGAGRLADGDNPFRMTRGQWRFVIDAWHAANADDPSEEASTQSDTFQPTIVDLPSTERLQPTVFQPTPTVLPNANVNPTAFTFENISAGSSAVQSHESLAESQVRFRELEQRFEMFIRSHNDDTRRMQQTQEALTRRLTQMETERNATLQSIRMLHERVLPIEQTMESGGAGIGLSTVQTDKLDELDRAVFGAQGPFSNLKLQFSQFKDKIESGGGLECHGVSFSSKRELISWFNEKEPPVEIFLDGLAYLHAIKPPVVHQDEASRQRESQLKTSMTNYLQVAVLTSFDTIIPSVLVGGKKMTDGGGSVFSWLQANLKSFEIWKPKGGRTYGVAQQIRDGIGRVTERTTELRDLHTADPQAILLSTGLCSDSATFCHELVRFITEQQDALTADTTFSVTQVWEMQLECLQKIIEELSEARESVADAARHTPAYYLWGMLKAWKIQQRYLSNHFKDDPALTGIMVRRILMQGQDSTVRDKLAKIDALANKMDEHHRQKNNELKNLKDAVEKLKK
jgi:hypothetical protein